MNNIDFIRILNKLNLDELEIQNLLEKHGANFRDPSNLDKVFHDATVDLKKRYRGYPADFDFEKVKEAVAHVWNSRSKIQHSVGSQGDDMPMVGQDIPNRFESFQNWLEATERKAELAKKHSASRKNPRTSKRGYIGGNPKYRGNGDKRDHPEDSRNVSGSNKNIDASHM